MTSISLPPQSQSTLASPDFSLHGHTRRNLSMSGPFPLPNPPFVFPARDPENSVNDNSPPPAAPEPPTVRTPPASLPAFSFNPGSDQPPQTPTLTPPVNRPGGHRRRPSEFIGGERLVSPESAETGQKSDENTLQSPANLPAPGPGFSAGGPGKRRHAHRRSAAISSVDLTAISNALDVKPTLGSAPCTSDRKRDNNSYDEIPRPMSHSATTLPPRSPPGSPFLSTGGDSPSHSQPVFSNPFPTQSSLRSEILPEPSGSTSTIQPEQAARNSNPPAIEISPSDDQKPRVRPKTADAWLFDQSGNSAAGDGLQPTRPFSTGHSRAHKSLSSGLLDAALRKKNNTNDDAHLTDSSPRSSSDDGSDTEVDNEETKKSKSKARKKKVRSWAGSLLTRGKGKRNQSRKDTPEPNMPKITRTNSDLGSGLDVDFDDDNIVILRAPTNPQVPPTSSQPSQPEDESETPQPRSSLESSWKPKSFYEQGLPNDTLSPVIDLDAALGPFNTPGVRTENTAAESGFSAATKRMYSGGRRGEFIGPEMRYHRRAESAPEMPPFDRSALNGNKRLTTHSSMENPDVFYEEEEDAFLAATSEPSQEDERRPSQAGSVIVDNGNEPSDGGKDSSDTLTRQPAAEDDAANAQHEHDGLGITRKNAEIESPPSATCSKFPEPHSPVDRVQYNARNPFMNPPRTPVDTIKQEEWQHHRVPAPPSPDVSPRFTPADKRPATSPIELGPHIPPFSLQGGPSQPSSALPSPDFTGSPSDVSRSVRTPSTTDRNFFHPSFNNMSADFPHASIEDVPSLTSSASTSTNPMQRFSAGFWSRRGSSDRAASFSAAVNRRTSASHAAKRSSLASLSKLMVGSHANERSKLSYEEKPPSDVPEKAKKKGRGISRLVHFWRTKDKDKSNGDTSQEQEQRPT